MTNLEQLKIRCAMAGFRLVLWGPFTLNPGDSHYDFALWRIIDHKVHDLFFSAKPNEAQLEQVALEAMESMNNYLELTKPKEEP